MEKSNQYSPISELNKLLRASTEEERQKILYVLDYVLNYFIGERRIPKISEYGFFSQIEQLRKIGVVKELKIYWRGHKYTRLALESNIEGEIRSLLKEKYHPQFTEEYVERRIREIVRSSFSAATKLWHKVQEYEAQEYELSGPISYDQDIIKLGEKIASEGLGYLIGYWTTSWTHYYDEIIFRKQPLDVRSIFIKVVEEEITQALSSFSPEMKWCLYLMYVNPKADKTFFLKNTTIWFLPYQIKNALSRIPHLKVDKLKELAESILAEQREKLSEIIRSLINRDPAVVTILSLLFMLGREEERYYMIDSWSLGKIKETLESVSKYEQFNHYLTYLKNYGVVLTTDHELIIPKLVWEVFYDEIKGRATEVRIFESELEAQSFIEERMSKGVSNIKIWDPYVSTKTLMIVERSIRSKDIKVEILSSLPIITGEIIQLRNKGLNLSAKIIYLKRGEKYLSPWHDRYLIIDNTNVWHFGPSLHAAGQKGWESAELFPQSLGKMIVDAFVYNFMKKKEDWEKEGYEVVEIGVN